MRTTLLLSALAAFVVAQNIDIAEVEVSLSRKLLLISA